MARPNSIELPDCKPIRILYEDRAVMAVDKPPGWMLVPDTWQRTSRNLQAAITSSIAGGDFWARSRGLKFLRYVHRLDADTSGVLLFAKSPGAVESLGDMFETRRMEKTYLAVTAVEPRETEWICRLALMPDPQRIGRMIVDEQEGKASETHFRVIEKIPGLTLIECRPVTGRTHQIRVHLAESGCPIVSDGLYGRQTGRLEFGLRATRLAYADPFTKKRVEIVAPAKYFLKDYGFSFQPAVAANVSSLHPKSGIMSWTNFAGGGDAAPRRSRPAGRNERGKSDLSPSPDAAPGDEDSAARRPYLD